MFRVSHWFLEHHVIKQHHQKEKDLQIKKHLRIKTPSQKKQQQKLYHIIIKLFLRIGKHHLHNSHKTDSFLPFWDLYSFWKKRDRKTGQSLQQLVIFHSSVLLGKSITRQKSLLRNLYLLPGQYSWVATSHTNRMFGYWFVGM